jgi:hypothetical protein
MKLKCYDLKRCGAAVLVLSIAASAKATLIAADSYVTTQTNSSGYVPNSNLYGQSVTPPGTIGFTGAYTDGGASPTGAFQVVNTGLSYSTDAYSGGGSVEAFTDYNNTGSGISRSVDRALASYTPASTYYISGLFQLPATVHTAKAAIGFTNVNTTNTVALPTNALGAMFGLDGGNFAVWANNSSNVFTESTITSSPLSAGSTNFFVAKLTYIGANDTTLDVWLNPSDTSSEAAMGAPTAELTTSALADAGTTMDLTRLNFGVATSATNATMTTFTDPGFFDEPRLATDFASAVAEPATLAVFGSCAVLLLCRRRRTSH